MQKITLFVFIQLLQCTLHSVEFVLFTQPKTATHLLIPILHELTHKNVYWAPEHTQTAPTLTEEWDELFTNSERFVFSLERKPWTKQTMNLVWKTHQNKKTFLHLHAPFSPTMESYLKKKKSINFFIKRDPRDQIVSLLNHYKHIQCNDKKFDEILDDGEKLLYLIKTKSRNHTIHYMNWIYSPICCVLDFEKLMGIHGGAATSIDAMEQMRTIAIALQLDISDQKLERIYQNHFGHGWSFFKGKVGVWREYFQEEHKTAIKEEIGDLLIQLGYENDFTW